MRAVQAAAYVVQGTESVQGVADQPSWGQGFFVGERAHLPGDGGGRADERGLDDLLAEVLGHTGEGQRVADPQDAFGVERPIGQRAPALGLPQHGQLVDGLAAVMQGAQGAVDLLVAGVREVTRTQPVDDVEELLGPGADAAEEELLVGEDLFVDRLRLRLLGGRRDRFRGGTGRGSVPQRWARSASTSDRTWAWWTVSSTPPRTASARAAWWRRMACWVTLRWMAPSRTIRP